MKPDDSEVNGVDSDPYGLYARFVSGAKFGMIVAVLALLIKSMQ